MVIVIKRLIVSKFHLTADNETAKHFTTKYLLYHAILQNFRLATAIIFPCKMSLSLVKLVKIKFSVSLVNKKKLVCKLNRQYLDSFHTCKNRKLIFVILKSIYFSKVCTYEAIKNCCK